MQNTVQWSLIANENAMQYHVGWICVVLGLHLATRAPSHPRVCCISYSQTEKCLCYIDLLTKVHFGVAMHAIMHPHNVPECCITARADQWPPLLSESYPTNQRHFLKYCISVPQCISVTVMLDSVFVWGYFWPALLWEFYPADQKRRQLCPSANIPTSS